MITLWHVTRPENVAPILANGFEDRACVNKRLFSENRFKAGVWVSTLPLLDDELFDGSGLFSFDAERQRFILVRAELADAQTQGEHWIDETWHAGDQLLMPAAWLNTCERQEIHIDGAIKFRLRQMTPKQIADLSEWVKENRGYQMPFVERVRAALRDQFDLRAKAADE